MERLLLTPEEAARVLGVARSRMYLMLQRGEVRFVLIGNKKRVPAEWLKTWVEEQMAAGSSVAVQRRNED